MSTSDDMKLLLKVDFREQLKSLLFKKTLLQIIADSTLDRPFTEIVLEGYQEVLDEYKQLLTKDAQNG